MKARTIGLTVLGLLVLAASAAAKEKEYLDGTMLDFKEDSDFKIVEKHQLGWHKRTFSQLTIKAGDTIYVSYIEKGGGLAAHVQSHGFHPEDYPVNSPVKIRLEKSRLAHVAGFKGYLYLQRPDGKETQTLWYSATPSN